MPGDSRGAAFRSFRSIQSLFATRWVIGLLVAFGLLEFALAIVVAFFGPVAFQLGPISITASGSQKPALYALMLTATVLWLADVGSVSARSRVSPVQAAHVLGTVGLIAGLVALASPMLAAGWVLGHDVGAHTTYSFLFGRALWQGQFPVRWVEWTEPGYGQPLFNYYQVGFYYLVSWVDALGLGLTAALKTTVLALWMSGAGFVYLLGRRYGHMPALVAAAVYAHTPYLLVDVYVRAAYPELAALSFVPAMLWALDATLRTGRGVYLAALSSACLLIVLCHLPTSVVVAPLAPAYGLFLLLTGETTTRRLSTAAGAGILGLGLSAFYLVPALAELEQISMSRMTSGYFDYRNHFVVPSQWFDRRWGFGGSEPGLDDGMPLQLGLVQWVIAGAAFVVATGTVALRQHRRVGVLYFWLAVLAFALFMMTDYSERVWALLAPLAFIQFPWRFFLLVPLATGLLAAATLSFVEHRTVQALLAMLLVVTPPYWTRQYVTMTLEWPRVFYEFDRAESSSVGNLEKPFREPAYDPTGRTPAPVPPERWTVTRGSASVTTESLRDDRVRLVVQSEEGAGLTINTVWMPGWRTWIDGEEYFELREGRLHVNVPPGRHRVEAHFMNTPARTVGNAITVASLGACGLWLASVGKNRRYRIRKRPINPA